MIVGGEGGGKWTGGFDRALWALMLSPFVGQKLSGLVSGENAEDLLVLKELIEAGKVTPVIEKTYPLSDTAVAIRHLADGHARGKLVVTV